LYIWQNLITTGKYNKNNKFARVMKFVSKLNIYEYIQLLTADHNPNQIKPTITHE